MDKIAVLIPCYNEAQTIGKVISDIQAALPDATIYVYDNNSSDATVEIAENAGAIVRWERQQGKGSVIRRMFREIDAQCYLLLDGDDTYPAESAPDMCRKVVDEKHDMVIGDRLSTTYFEENKRRFHNFGNNFVRDTINRLFDCSITDVLTGYRAFSYLFVKSFPVLSEGFEIETEMTIHAVEKKLLVASIPVIYRDRPAGSSSKINTITDGIRIVKTIFNLCKNYRPLMFFGVISIALFVVAMFFLTPVLITYFITSQVPQFPTLFACGFTFVAAIQCGFSGLILSTIRHKNMQDFEYRLIAIGSDYNEKIEKTRHPIADGCQRGPLLGNGLQTRLMYNDNVYNA